MLLTSNCEDMLRDVFCVDQDFTFTAESIKAKFDELNNSSLRPKGKVPPNLYSLLRFTR